MAVVTDEIDAYQKIDELITHLTRWAREMAVLSDETRTNLILLRLAHKRLEELMVELDTEGKG